MKTTVTLDAFREAFKRMERDNFSYEGLEALYEFLTALEGGIGEKLELDVIAFCCEYTEFDNLKEYNEAYNKTHKKIVDIQNDTTLILIDDNSFIIQNY